MAHVINVRTDIDRDPWTHLDPERTSHGQVSSIGLLRHGTTEGRASVALVIDLDDGTSVIAETTWRALKMAFAVLHASPIASEEV